MKLASKNTLFFLAIVGCILSGVLGWRVYQSESSAIQQTFKNNIDDKVALLERELIISLEALYALKGLFDNSENVTASEFSDYAKSLIARHNNIQALEWAPKVTQQDRATFVEKNLNNFAFDITERESQGLMVKANTRKHYFPVYFIEPFVGNELALGFDLASNISRKESLEQAMHHGEPVASSSIILVQEQKQERGFLIFFPVFHDKATTPLQRQQNIKGFIVGAFRISDIFSSALKRTLATRLNIKLIDVTNGRNDLIHENRVSQYSEMDALSSFTYHKLLTPFYSRNWKISATPTSEYVANLRTLLPFVTAFSSALIIILALYYSYLITLRNSELNIATSRLKQLSETDALTGISNRRYFDQYIAIEWQRAVRAQTSLAILMIDVDHFKLFNDIYGHVSGDKCLIDVARAIAKSATRASDFAVRYGGEEFSVVLPDTEHVKFIAEQCKAAVEQLHIPHIGSNVSKHVTVSIGATSVKPTKNLELTSFICQADTALYQAKEQGRNKICEL
jgi:diguanylate cyclase (GGDEF)-like protein